MAEEPTLKYWGRMMLAYGGLTVIGLFALGMAAYGLKRLLWSAS